ncbi:iron-sulfur cluster assembly scaffold protein [Candidatus Woesearchaeota archaeon]|nr:iron-sulfur cluster assembly scaffold protein [Candidatus Woesearchaeota archaeon]
MFTKEALKRFRNPKNTGKLKDFDAEGKAGDPECSDLVHMQVKFHRDKVIDAKFKVFGCPGAIATTDVFIDMIKGRPIEYAFGITENNIADALGGLPVTHLHCSNLSIEAFRKAVEDYKNGLTRSKTTAGIGGKHRKRRGKGKL